jgi:catechol 2,3-dioxygenase-like lactoylglutathione lyase family enzyme
MHMDFTGMTVQLHVANGTEARAWYERLLGRPPDVRPDADDTFVEWHFQPGYWELHIVQSDQPGTQQGRLRLGVREVEAARHSLVDSGLEVTEVEELPRVVRWCNFDDPWGNRLGLYQDLARFELTV